MSGRPFVLWLEWQGFYADDSLGEPQVVVRDQSVLDANLLARSQRIEPGMTVQEARNIVPDVVRQPWREEDFTSRQHAWLDLCLPYTHRLEPIDGHVAALDLSDHPQPRDIAERLTEHLVSELGLPLRHGAGPSKWVAALASRSHDLRRAIEDPAGFLAPLPIEWLAPVETAHRRRLAFLGYRRIGEVARLPVATLRAQFGEAGWHIFQAARGSFSDPVKPSYPKDSVAATLSFEGPIDNIEILERGYTYVACELAERLAGRNAVAKRVDLTMHHEDGEITTVSRTFARSLAKEQDLFSAFRLMLPVPPEKPVERLRVFLPEIRKARRVQLNVEGGRSGTDVEESVRTAIMHVCATFGEGVVLQGKEVEVPRWLRVRRAYRDAFGWAWL